MKSYVGVVVPYYASGRFTFRICYPSKNQQPDCRSGEVALFGLGTQQKIKSLPIDTDHFTYAKTLISNDDSRKIKVDFKNFLLWKE